MDCSLQMVWKSLQTIALSRSDPMFSIQVKIILILCLLLSVSVFAGARSGSQSDPDSRTTQPGSDPGARGQKWIGRF